MAVICDFSEPFNHGSIQVNHLPSLALLAWPAECLWAQLQSERYLAEDKDYSAQNYLSNLEREWSRRGLCSRCLEELRA